MNTKSGSNMEDVSLINNTYILSDKDSYIVYNPYAGFIIRTYNFPQSEKDFSLMKKNGFFGNLPLSVEKHNKWKGFSGLTFLLTRKCNLRCVYCYATAGLKDESMSVQLAEDSVDWFIKNSNRENFTVAFHGGGEPTLEKQLIKHIVSLCKKSGKEVRYLITTNGTFSIDFLNWMIKNEFGISISMDGPSDIQNYNRPFRSGYGSSFVVERNIKYLRESQYPFSIRMTFSLKDNLSRIINYFADVGVKKIHLEPLFPYGREYKNLSFEERNKIGELVGLKLANQLINALDICRKRGVKVYNSHLVHFTDGIGYFCASASCQRMTVTHDGFLVSCLEVVDREDETIDVFGIGKWESESHAFVLDYNKISYFLNRHAEMIPDCRNCYARYICAGGCAIKAYRCNNKLQSKDPSYCTFTRTLIPAIIRRIAYLSEI